MIKIENGEKITPHLAELWLNSNYENQRQLREYHVNYLANEMKLGRFMPTVTIAFCLMNGKSHLVNGQHTLHAIIRSGTVQELGVQRTSVDTPSELAQIYTTYDIQSKRTLRDAIHAHKLEYITGLPVESITRLCSACTWIERGFTTNYHLTMSSRKVLSYQDQIDLASPWFEEMKKLTHDIIAPCGTVIRNKIHKAGVLSMALLTVKYRQGEARKFWKQVAQDDGLKIGDPRKTLRNWILKYDDNSKARYPVHPNTFSIAVMQAWNKFMMEESLKTIVIKNNDEKISLVGIDDGNIKKHTNIISRIELCAMS